MVEVRREEVDGEEMVDRRKADEEEAKGEEVRQERRREEVVGRARRVVENARVGRRRDAEEGAGRGMEARSSRGGMIRGMSGGWEGGDLSSEKEGKDGKVGGEEDRQLERLEEEIYYGEEQRDTYEGPGRRSVQPFSGPGGDGS